jgi:transposase
MQGDPLHFYALHIAKLTFIAAIKVNEKDKVKSFSNNEEGFKNFVEWLQDFSAENGHYCIESTGKYGNALALFLHKKNSAVSIVNPAKIKYFMKSQLARNKTDSIDAKLIRNYCELFTPSLWQPLPAGTRITSTGKKA